MPRPEFSMCQRDCCMKADNEMSVVSGGHSDTKKILPNIRISLLRSYPYYLSSPLCFMAREGWLIFSSLKNEGKKIFISHFCPIALTNSHFLQGKRVLKNPLLFHFWWWLNEVINETLSDKKDGKDVVVVGNFFTTSAISWNYAAGCYCKQSILK